MKIITSLFYRNSPLRGKGVTESNRSPSDTVPDQSLTVRELLRRHAAGTLNEIEHELIYTEDMPDMRGLDLVEKLQMQADNKAFISDTQTKLKRKKDATTRNSPDSGFDGDIDRGDASQQQSQ